MRRVFLPRRNAPVSRGGRQCGEVRGCHVVASWLRGRRMKLNVTNEVINVWTLHTLTQRKYKTSWEQ